MDIFDEIRHIQREMDKMFDNFFRGTRNLLPSPLPNRMEITPAVFQEFRTPAVNVYETDKSVVAEFELPGVDKKDINLNVTEDSIEVKVDKKLEKQVKRKGYYVYEAQRQGFFRRIPLPMQVIPEKTKAEFKNGVLRVECPKQQTKRTGRRINID